jgi:hypothetical protein
MIKYTESAKAKINNDNPANQLVQLGEKIGEIQNAIGAVDQETASVSVKPIVTIQYEITADASSGVNIYNASVPFSMTIIDVIAEARATSASGTITVSDGTNDITDAIALATDTNIDKAATIDNDYSTLAIGDTLTVTTNGANDRGLISIIAVIN